MREEEFKMERKELLDIVKVGETLPIKEFALPNSYYYVLGRAYAMSANYKGTERILSKEGIILNIEETSKGYFVTVGFEA